MSAPQAGRCAASALLGKAHHEAGRGESDSRRSPKGATAEDRQPGVKGRGVTEEGRSCPVCPCIPHSLLAQNRASETVSLPAADFGAPRLAKCYPLALAGSLQSGLAALGGWVLGRHVTPPGTRSTLSCPLLGLPVCRQPAASLGAC